VARQNKKVSKKRSRSRPPQTKLTRFDKLCIYGFDKLADLYISTLTHGKWIVVAYFTYRSIDTLSGEETIAKFIVDVATDVKLPEWLAYLFGVGGVGYGYAQNRFRKNKVAELSDRCRGLEKIIDPGRSSSKMPPTGETREEDKR